MSLDEEFEDICIKYEIEYSTCVSKDLLLRYHPLFEKYDNERLASPILKLFLFRFFAKYYYDIEINYEKSIVYLKKCLFEIEKIDKNKLIDNNLLQLSIDEQDEVLKCISLVSFKLGNTRNSEQLNLLKQYVYFNSAYIFNKENTNTNYDLYSYRYINKFCLQDLINREITVVDPKMFNDPTDCPIYTILNKMNNYKDAEDNKPLKDAYSFMKIRCFVSNKSVKTGNLKQLEPQKEEYKNFLMWSHYAESHKGVCIKYRLNQNFLEFNHKLQVGSGLMDVKYTEKQVIGDCYSIDEQTAFATKNSCWSYENEVRLIHYDPNCDSPVKALPLGENGNVEAVYFGLKCPKKDIETIRGILTEDVAYFQMKEDDEDIFKLVEVPLNQKAEALLAAAAVAVTASVTVG